MARTPAPAPGTDPVLDLGPACDPGLALLLEAYDRACQLGDDPWQWALDLPTLTAAGLTHTILRFLLCQQYLLQAIEVTRPTHQRRSFRPVRHLGLHPHGCFVLTPAGAAAVRAHAADPQAGVVPTWHTGSGELRWRGRLVKRFDQPAPAQRLILDAFQEEGWPPRIDNPFSGPAGLARERLERAIKHLNRHHVHPHLLHFRGDGTGTGVLWVPGPRRT